MCNGNLAMANSINEEIKRLILKYMQKLLENLTNAELVALSGAIRERLTNSELVGEFEAIRDKLNLQTITSYKNAHGCSYNGVKFRKNLRTEVQETEYIVDNETERALYPD